MTLEAVLLTPTILLVVGMLIFFTRYAIAAEAIQNAAVEAARAASIARTAGAATSGGAAAATATLSNHGVRCSSSSVAVGTAPFATAVGTDATVNVTVRCVVDDADLLLPGTPGQMSITKEASSPLDRYRGRA